MKEVIEIKMKLGWVLHWESQRVQQDKTADHLLLGLRTIKVLRQAIFSKLTGGRVLFEYGLQGGRRVRNNPMWLMHIKQSLYLPIMPNKNDD